ncbi:MAG: DMT family transporter, partial [Pseudomonadota bacterium]
VFTGTLIAIAFRERLKEETQGSRVGYWEAADGATLAGIGYALLAALGHSGAVIMLDGVMSNPSIDPFAASAIRVGAACLAFGVWCALMARGKVRSYLQNHDPQRIRQDLIAVFASASCGITLGMTFIVLALKSGSPGIVTVMASTTPIISLPILWLVAGKRPNPTAWIGAALAVCGTSLIALAPAAIG